MQSEAKSVVICFKSVNAFQTQKSNNFSHLISVVTAEC